jgi:hypothetical protein
VKVIAIRMDTEERAVLMQDTIESEDLHIGDSHCLLLVISVISVMLLIVISNIRCLHFIQFENTYRAIVLGL